MPQSISNLSRYNLRNSNVLQTIDARTNQYFYSFLPSSVRAWNSLPAGAKQCETINFFNAFVKEKKHQLQSTIMQVVEKAKYS